MSGAARGRRAAHAALRGNGSKLGSVISVGMASGAVTARTAQCYIYISIYIYIYIYIYIRSVMYNSQPEQHSGLIGGPKKSTY